MQVQFKYNDERGTVAMDRVYADILERIGHGAIVKEGAAQEEGASRLPDSNTGDTRVVHQAHTSQQPHRPTVGNQGSGRRNSGGNSGGNGNRRGRR